MISLPNALEGVEVWTVFNELRTRCGGTTQSGWKSRMDAFELGVGVGIAKRIGVVCFHVLHLDLRGSVSHQSLMGLTTEFFLRWVLRYGPGTRRGKEVRYVSFSGQDGLLSTNFFLSCKMRSVVIGPASVFIALMPKL